MDELERFELHSLTNSIQKLLLNNIGMDDKVLAEFLIDLHDSSASLSDFRNKLKESGSEFPESFITSMDRLVLSMHPKYKKKKAAAAASANGNGTAGTSKTMLPESEDQIRQRKLFPGLAMPDSQWKPSFEADASAGKIQAPVPEVEDFLDDMMAQLEGAESRIKNSTSGSTKRKRSISPPVVHNRNGRRASPDYQQQQQSSSSSRHYDDDNRGRSSAPRYGGGAGRLDDKPILYKIYNGKVTGIKDFGAFVALEGIHGRAEGMVHISAIQSTGRVNHPSDLLARGQPVKVKIVSMAGTRLGLSMKDVDQESGRDLTPHLQIGSEANMAHEDPASRFATGSNGGPLGRTAAAPLKFADDFRSSAKRLTSPERWEIKQLIASGAASAADYPNLDQEDFATPNTAEADEELDIEVREDEAPFLAGQAKRALEISPVKIIKAPDGTLNRAALSGASLAKERRELRQQEATDATDAEEKDLTSAWQDPMAQAHDRQFAADLRGQSYAKRNETAQQGWKGKKNEPVTFGKITNLSITEQRASLPIFQFREQLIAAIRESQVLVVVGETGSGKTTQMTQYLAEEGFADHGRIGCTQPRRVAAMSVAKRVAEEVGCRLGQEVGYTIRFEDCTSPETRIKYMTDGMLQREALVDPDMTQYSVIMMDEAHERSIPTDVLFGLMKKTLKRRPDLKLIVTSATMDAEKFARYFNNCSIFTIPGRTYPVEVLYSREPESDYLDAALITVMQIHLSEPPGDILLFLTGQEEIDTSCEILYERMKALGPQVPELLILPVYSALPSEIQSKIFDPAPPGARKVVIATNIAETSITIDGIYYVIDPGFVKQNAYDPRLGMDSLVVVPISQAQARQRAGRAGRTGPGKCYRLYTEAAYRNEMLPNPIPDIMRANLSSTILNLKAMGINDLLNFDFMDPPPHQSLITALEGLYALSALDDEGLLTRLGRKMADFPMDPPLAKMLIVSVELGCSEEILTIVAMLTAGNIFYRPKDKQAQADAKKAKFHQPEGDHLTLLQVYNGWKNSKFSNPWCHENYLQARSMRRAQDVRKQLLGIMDRYKHEIVSCGRNFNRARRAIASGFFRHAAKKDPQEGYKTLVEGTPVFIHPSSSLFNRQPEWLVYHELLLTTKEYCREVTAIEPKWLAEVAPNFFKVSDASKLSKRKKQEKIEPLYNKFQVDKDDWRISKVRKNARTSQTFG